MKQSLKKNDNNIQVLIYITEHADEATNAIEIALLEVCTENMGSGKKLDYTGECLIAFASRESFKRGRDVKNRV